MHNAHRKSPYGGGKQDVGKVNNQPRFVELTSTEARSPTVSLGHSSWANNCLKKKNDDAEPRLTRDEHGHSGTLLQSQSQSVSQWTHASCLAGTGALTKVMMRMTAVSGS